MSALVLGIETSCDETSAAVVRDGRVLLSNVILSQIKDHAVFGGVVPEIASRKHVEAIIPVIDEALSQAGIGLRDVSAVAATYGPGLAGALLVGLSAAKGLAFAAHKPLIGVHHIAAHICANYLAFPELKPPFTALVVSGGHSHIFLAEDYRVFRLMGRTRDDAAGEVFDKVARASGLGYPGGPKLDRAAQGGNPDAIRFPVTRFRDGTFDFSFSGVKTAAINWLRRESAKWEGATPPPTVMPDFYASFQKAVVDILVENAVAAERENHTGKIVLAGGVAANSLLRRRLAEDTAAAGGIECCYPPPILCTDNAAMVASAAYWQYEAGLFSPLSLNASPGAPLQR